MSAVLQLFPEILDVNGDAQNALVLAQRARWAGCTTELLAVGLNDAAPTARPAAVVIGSGVDADLERARDALRAIESRLRDWVAAGIPLLAIGTGFELLTSGIDLPSGTLSGLGLLPGRASPLPARATGDAVVEAPEGRLVGFENHARGVSGRGDSEALGVLRRGVGHGDGTEGARLGSVWATHLHGPVLARNPELADAIAVAAFGDEYRADDSRIRSVDVLARRIRDGVLAERT